MITENAPTNVELSLKLSASAAEALNLLTESTLNAFDSKSDVLSQAITLIAWSSVKVRNGAELGCIRNDGQTFARVTLPFIERIGGIMDTMSGAPGGEAVSIAVSDSHNKVAQHLLRWSSKPFEDINDLANQALVLLSYTFTAKTEGNYFGSVQEENNVVTEVRLPFVDRVGSSAKIGKSI